MRILLAAGPFPPDPGGPATHLTYLLPELRARGHDVRAIAFGNPDPDDASYPVTRVPLSLRPIPQLNYARVYGHAAQWADVVYATSLGLPRPWPRRPTLLRVPGDRAWERAVNRGWVSSKEDIDRFQTSRHGLRVQYVKWLRSREARRADRIVVPSHYLRDMVVGWGVAPGRVSVIYSAIAADVTAGPSRVEARAQLGWSLDGRYLVAAARLTAWKGLDVLIRAVGRLRDVTLVIVGDGPERQALGALALECGADVQFSGAVDRQSLARYLVASDYLVLYSGYEGLSHTILESLRAGTPVIASDRGGNAEVVRHDANGLLVPHPDPDALDRALAYAFDGETRARLAAGTPIGLERFSWTVAGPAVVNELEKLDGVGSR